MRIASLNTPLGKNAQGEDILVFRQLEGREGVSELFDYTLIAHSSQQDIAPTSLIGKSVTVTVQDQFQNGRFLNAIVTDFAFLGGDQRQTQYRLHLAPWLALTQYSADCRIFQNMSIVDIVSQVLGNYPFPLKKKLADSYPKLTFTVQYNESDFQFVSRLLERAGIAYYFEHDEQSHTLVLADLMSVYTSLSNHSTISFRAPDKLSIAKEETISRWNPGQRIVPGSFATGDYNYRAPFANLGQTGTGTFAPKQHAFDELAVYKWQGQGYYGDRQPGADIVKLKQDQQQQKYQGIELDSDVRALAIGATGHSFTLQDHPLGAMNQEVLLLSTWTFVKENASITDNTEPPVVRVSAMVMPTEYQYRPQLITPLPIIDGPQSAMVVGAAGSEIWTNDLGEVKLKFLWDRYSSGDENSSCWIRVCSTWAGQGWGCESVPRVGTEVIVSFLDGNPDHPIVIGRAANSSRLPPSFSNTGALPANQAIAGMKSRELQGGRYNQWLFDDTTGEIRMHLESEHAKTQLNLGYQVHPRNKSAKARGEGFELRTDAWGTLRATKGVFVTANDQLAAGGDMLARGDLVAGLETALQIAKTLGQSAEKNQGNPLDLRPQEKLAKAVNHWGQGSNSEKGGDGGAPVFAAHAPAGIALGTHNNASMTTGENIDVVTQENQHFAAGKQINLHAGQGISQYAEMDGMKSIARKGKQIIQAQDDDINIAAYDKVQITATQDHVLIAAEKKITLTSGGGYITIENGNIEIHCPGKISIKGNNYTKEGPDSMSVQLPQFGSN